ncbi:MAG TPA: hypothetical protein VLB83_05010 [Candidatus Paceibacterota bacterium]|nr:hypothetical protein [Candidatus Paceibacterota bacterium]
MRRLTALLLLCTLLAPDAALFAQTSSAGLPAPVVETIASDRVMPLPSTEDASIESAEMSVRANTTKAEAEVLKKQLFAYAKKTGSLIAYTKLRMLEHRFPSEKIEQKQPYSSSVYLVYPPHHSSYLRPTNMTLGHSDGSSLADSYLSITGAQQEIDFLTGAKAVNESLQLGSIAPRRPEALIGEENIPIATVPAVEIRSHPWASMRAGKPEPTIPALFDRVPADAFVIYFSKASSGKEIEDAFRSIGSSGAMLFDLDPGFSPSSVIGRRLGISDLSQRLASDFALAEMAFVSEDLDFARGTEFALILRPKAGVPPEAILAFADKDKAHTSIIGGMVVMATSKRYLDKITGPGMRPMSREQDLAYMLTVLDPARDGFAFLSESFIRMLTGPAYRTAAARRSMALTKIEGLQYMALAHRSISGAWPKTFAEIAEAGYADPEDMRALDATYAISADGVVSSVTWGTLAAPRSIGDVPATMITEGERTRYQSFREGYEQLWREFFDPIGVAFRVGDHLAFHTVILPLIESSDYNFAKGLFGGSAARAPFDGVTRPPRNAPITAMSRLDLDRYLLENDALIREALSVDGTWSIASEHTTTYALMGALRDALGKRAYSATRSCRSGVFADSSVASALGEISAAMGIQGSCASSGSEWAASWHVASTTLHACVDSRNPWGWTYAREGVVSSACPTQQVSFAEREKVFSGIARGVWDKYTLAEKKAKINALIASEAEDIRFSTPFDAFGLIGSEVQFGIGEQLPFEIERIADYDGYIGIKLADPERFNRYLNEIFQTYAEQMNDSGAFGLFTLSSKEPLKNSYGGIEYSVIPTGFVNLYYLFRGDYVYFFVSQLGVNNMIEGLAATSTKPTLTPLQSRAKSDIGDGPDIMALVDLEPLSEYKKKTLDRTQTWGGYALSSRASRVHGYLADYQWAMRMLGAAIAKETFFRNAPATFQGVPVSVTPSGIRFRENGPRFDEVDFLGTPSSSLFGLAPTQTARATGTVPFSSVVTADDKARLLSEMEKFKGFGVGLAFTKDGLDVRVSIKNPNAPLVPSVPVPCESDDCATWFDGLSKQVVNIGFGILALLLLGGAGFAVWRMRRARSLGSELAAPAAISNLGSTLDAPAAIVQSGMHPEPKTPPVAPVPAAPSAVAAPVPPSVAEPSSTASPASDAKPKQEARVPDAATPVVPPPVPAPEKPVPPPAPTSATPSLAALLTKAPIPAATKVAPEPAAKVAPIPPAPAAPVVPAAPKPAAPEQKASPRSSFLANLISATKVPAKSEILPPASTDLIPQLPLVPPHASAEEKPAPVVASAPSLMNTLPPDLFTAHVRDASQHGMPPARTMPPRVEPLVPHAPTTTPVTPPAASVEAKIESASEGAQGKGEEKPAPLPPETPQPAPSPAAIDFDDMFIPIPVDLRDAVSKGEGTST